MLQIDYPLTGAISPVLTVGEFRILDPSLQPARLRQSIIVALVSGRELPEAEATLWSTIQVLARSGTF